MMHQCRSPHHLHMGDPKGAVGGASPSTATVFPHLCSPSAVRLTVWCKSLLFNGKGYTVYDDSDGRMVFRVDNYAQNWREEAHLMDRAGNVLLTVRRCRKKLSITNSWEVYEGDHDVSSRLLGGEQRPLFRVTKALGNPSCTVSLVSHQQEGASAPAFRMSWSRHDERSRIFAGPAGTPPVAESATCVGGFLAGAQKVLRHPRTGGAARERCSQHEGPAGDGPSLGHGPRYDQQCHEMTGPTQQDL